MLNLLSTKLTLASSPDYSYGQANDVGFALVPKWNATRVRSVVGGPVELLRLGEQEVAPHETIKRALNKCSRKDQNGFVLRVIYWKPGKNGT